MHHWGCPLWAVEVESAPCGCCRRDCGRPGDVDHHTGCLISRCDDNHGDHHDDRFVVVEPIVAVVATVVVTSVIAA
jgi:hypothetical protein